MKLICGKIFTCTHCRGTFVIMPTRSGRLIPVKHYPGMELKPHTIFDGSIHISHLNQCPPRHADWHDVLARLGLPITIKKELL